MLKLYVGCALTEAPPEFRTSVAELKGVLKAQKLKNGEPKYEVLEFLGLVNGTPADVFHHDINECVGKCDLMLTIHDHPSTGLGWEACEAVKVRGIPVLGTALLDRKITRFVLGIPAHFKNFVFEPYRDLLEDVPKLLDKFVEEVKDEIWDPELGGPRWAFRPVRSYPD